MANHSLNYNFSEPYTAASTKPYQGACIVLATKHQKSIALAPAFSKTLGASMLEYIVDTDQLGTFSGEVERKGTPLDTVKRKCEWSIINPNIEYALASEGSFGPHPSIPFLPSNEEILYFLDNKRGFHLHIKEIFQQTNYQMKAVDSLEELQAFAHKALFPSHALILRPYPKTTAQPIFKGLSSMPDLEAAFIECQKASADHSVWVETDMRAHLNPTRMQNIALLGEKLATRLTCLCPQCGAPGWGIVAHEKGLPCEWCGRATEQVQSDILACTSCKYTHKKTPSSASHKADPSFCSACNP